MSRLKALRNGTLTALTLGVILAATYGCDQQKPKCSTGHGDFVAKYTFVAALKGDAAACQTVTGDMLGIQTYNAIGENAKPDLDRANIAIQSLTMGTLFVNAQAAGQSDPTATDHPYAQGDFAQAEPDGDFCTVPTLTAATQVLPAIDEDDANGISQQDATDQTYTWSNVKVYVTATALGSQLTANLQIDDRVAGTSCQYTVLAMYPFIPCTVPDPNDPTGMAVVPDENLCVSFAQPDLKTPLAPGGYPTGSGINPDFPVKCDPDLAGGACFLTGTTIPDLQ